MESSGAIGCPSRRTSFGPGSLAKRKVPWLIFTLKLGPSHWVKVVEADRRYHKLPETQETNLIVDSKGETTIN